MNAAFIAVRAVHYGSAMLLFGELLFALVVTGMPWRQTVPTDPAHRESARRRLGAVIAWSIATGLGTGALWLAFEAAAMAGKPIAEAIDPRTLALVLGKTEFGHVWLLRAALLAAIGIALVAMRRVTSDATGRTLAIAAMIVAGVDLAALAWAGHAGAAEGSVRPLHLGSDTLHLLAAGAWLGALPALAACLRSSQPIEAIAQATRRFSTLGVISVTALLASGIVNACLLVGTVPALFGTAYGRLLLAKVALFIAMLCIAAINRQRLTPQLARGDRDAQRRLHRNSLLEIAAGILVIAIVGALGITIPGAHQSAVWPFPYTLDLAPEHFLEARGALLLAVAIAAAGALALRAGAQRRSAFYGLAGVAALVASAATSAWSLAVPAYPTTYAASPVPYDVPAVTLGAARFAQACSVCHGPDGHGDGPAAATLPVRPANVVDHFMHHPPGETFWWIAHGIPGTPMPAFARQFDDTQIWTLVQFLRARSAAESGTSLGDRVDASPGVPVPDFTFERPIEGQQTLLQRRMPALIVLYSLPSSGARLDSLAAKRAALADAGVRVVPVPIGAAPADAGEHAANPLLGVVTSPDVAVICEWFARRAGDSTKLVHAELLVDGYGNLRARWIGLPAAFGAQTAAILAQAGILTHEKPPAASPAMHHMH